MRVMSDEHVRFEHEHLKLLTRDIGVTRVGSTGLPEADMIILPMKCTCSRNVIIERDRPL
jgi:hypothetical protein